MAYTYPDGTPWRTETFMQRDPVIGAGETVAPSDTSATRTGDGVTRFSRLPIVFVSAWERSPRPSGDVGGVSQSYVDAGLARKADRAELASALGAKADASALTSKADRADLAGKADTSTVTSVSAALASKADAAAVATALLAKADVSAVTAALGSKADASALSAKADRADLAAKADRADLAAKADASALAAKADAQAVADALAAKADRSELGTQGGGATSAAALTFDPAGTKLTARQTQAAIAELDAARDSDKTSTITAARQGVLLDSAVGSAGGLAPLGADKKVPALYLPAAPSGGTAAPASTYEPLGADPLVWAHGNGVGEETFERNLITGSVNAASGQAIFGYFTAKSTRDALSKIWIAMAGGATTMTYAELGLFAVDGSGNLTRVVSTGNDTTIGTVANAPAVRNLASGGVTRLGRYAVGALLVFASGTPKVRGQNLDAGLLGDMGIGAPVLATSITGQASLAASYTAGSLSPLATHIYAGVK